MVINGKRVTDYQISIMKRFNKDKMIHCSPDIARQIINKGWATHDSFQDYQRYEWQRPVKGAKLWAIWITVEGVKALMEINTRTGAA